MKKADELYALGDYTNAINTYAKVGTKVSKLQIARAYNAIGNYDKAQKEYETLVATDTTFQIASFELGKLYFKRKRAKQAYKVFHKLIKNSSNPEYYYQLGRTFQVLGKDSLAVSTFKNGLKKDSTHLRSLFQLSKFYVGEQLKDSTLKYANIGLSFYKNDVALINLKALAYFNNDEYEKAIPLFEALLALNEKKIFVYKKLGYSYFATGALEKAKTAYKEIIALKPSAPGALYNLGNVFWKERVLDSASFYINEAIQEKRVSLAREYRALRKLSGEQKDFKTSLKYAELVYNEDPNDFLNYYQICISADNYYSDPKVKLSYYEKFMKKFGTDKGFFSKFAQKRVTELKEEIHFSKK